MRYSHPRAGLGAADRRRDVRCSPPAPRPISRRPTPRRKPPTRKPAALRNQWTTTAAALAAAKKAAEAGDFDQAVASSKEAEALAKASIFQANKRERSLERRWKSSAEQPGSAVPRQATDERHRMNASRRPPRIFSTLAGAAALSRRIAARRRAPPTAAERLRSRTLRQCAHPAHDRHACAVAAGVFPRAERQSRDRRDGRASRRIWSAAPFSTASASGPTAPTPTPSPVSISKNPPPGSASSAASRI